MNKKLSVFAITGFTLVLAAAFLGRNPNTILKKRDVLDMSGKDGIEILVDRFSGSITHIDSRSGWKEIDERSQELWQKIYNNKQVQKLQSPQGLSADLH